MVTNGIAEGQRAKIDRFGLAPYFDCILVEGEHGFGKPDERIYRLALDKLGTNPDLAWMAGDHLEFDVAAPQRLGLRVIWVNHARRQLPPGSPVSPDRIVHRIGELLSIGVF